MGLIVWCKRAFSSVVSSHIVSMVLVRLGVGCILQSLDGFFSYLLNYYLLNLGIKIQFKNIYESMIYHLKS